MSQSPNTMNFLPEDYVANRQATRSVVLFVGLLLVVVAGIVATYMYVKWLDESTFIEQAKVNVQYEDAEKNIAQVNDIKRQEATMAAKFELASLLMERVPRHELLRRLTDLQPSSVRMVSLDISTKTIESTDPITPASTLEKAKREQEGLPPEPVRPPTRDVTIDIVSTADSDAEVGKYIAALSKCTLFTDVNLLFSEEFKITRESNSRNVRRFHVEMKLDPNADLRSTTVASSAGIQN